MPKRVCSPAKSSWSAEISMTRAKHLRESLSFMMIRPSLLAPWTKPPWHIGKLGKPRKPIVSRASYGSDTRITPAGRQDPFRYALACFQTGRDLRCSLPTQLKKRTYKSNKKEISHGVLWHLPN